MSVASWYFHDESGRHLVGPITTYLWSEAISTEFGWAMAAATAGGHTDQ